MEFIYYSYKLFVSVIILRAGLRNVKQIIAIDMDLS